MCNLAHLPKRMITEETLVLHGEISCVNNVSQIGCKHLMACVTWISHGDYLRFLIASRDSLGRQNGSSVSISTKIRFSSNLDVRVSISPHSSIAMVYI